MGAEAKGRGERIARHLQTALRQARLGDEAWAEAQARAQGRKPPAWLVAACDWGKPDAVCPLPYDAPAVCTALATDGSQIPLDRHSVAPCFLLNVGEIALHYGTGERPHLHSQATLHFRDEDIYEGGEAGTVSEKRIATRRMLAESDALKALIERHAARPDALALVDDPLILVFADQRESEREQRETIAQFCEMLAAGQQARVPVAGYLSRPGGRDVVGTLRQMLCEENCSHASPSPCSDLARLTDAQIFASLLPNFGDRSPVFGSAARSLSYYPEAQQIRFFYVNVGPEIARVEVPQWVVDDDALLHRVHVLCCDQARKGQGYPVALSEAHERAVVRGPERDAFLHLVENAFVREGIPAMQTRKALAKRTRVL